MSECLRELLETFRLPGESQQIARITEVFAEVYIEAGPGECFVPRMGGIRADAATTVEVKDSDAAYVLAYSIIMLNTDQHNPQNRVRAF